MTNQSPNSRLKASQASVLRPIQLKPGEKVSPQLLEKLRQVNDKYTQSKNFRAYKKDLREVFHLEEVKVTQSLRHCMGGFIEGEGSLNVGCKKHPSGGSGMYLDPEFSVTQHVNRVGYLYSALSIFETGRIRYKTGSIATFVYTIDNRVSLAEKVVPFYKQYGFKQNIFYKNKRVDGFSKLLSLFDEKAHLDPDKMVNVVLPLWDSLRLQVGQSNQSFPDLASAQKYARDNFNKSKNVNNKPK